MALAGDHVRQILLDSTYRNRKKFPHPTEFEATVKPAQSTIPSDPVAVGYILFNDVVVAYDNTTSPHRIQITSGITEYENRLLGRHVEILDPVTFALKGTSYVTGFSNPNPHIYIYVSPNISGVLPGDLIFIRQLSSTPLIRVNPNAVVAAGANSFQFSGGLKKEDYYKGMFLRKVNGTLGDDHRITGYDISTVPPTITFAPGVEIGGYLATDFIEIYRVNDNEGGLSEMGSITNRGIPINHEVRLEWLRIPRHPLYVNNTADFPVSLTLNVNAFSYLIIEFRNRSFGSSGIIQSNNLHSRSGQFIVPIEDLSTGVGKFYTLRSSSTITIQYNPNDTIHFSVKTPQGQTIQFDPEDEQSESLALPNPDMQVSALFSVSRVLM